MNQALVIEGWFVHGSVELRDDSGEAVEFEMNDGPSVSCMPGIAELIPKQPLEPNRGYVIELQPEYGGDSATERERTVRFTTGEASLAEEKLAPPKGRASVVVEEPSGISCGHPSGVLACVGTEDRSTQLEVIARAGEDILLRFLATRGSGHQLDAFYSLPQVPDCIELRHRGPTGRRSAPLSICGDELDLRMLSGDTWDLGVSCDKGTIRSGASSEDMRDRSDAGAGGPKLSLDEAVKKTKGGCSASGNRSSAANWSWILAGLFVVTGARRRSQGRRRSSTAANLT